MKFLLRKDKALGASVVALLALSFMMAGLAFPAHATTGLTVANTCSANSGVVTTSQNCSLTVANIGDLIVVVTGYGNGGDASNTIGVGVPTFTAGGTSMGAIVSVNDGVVLGGASCSATNCHGSAIFSFIATASGATSIVGTYTSCDSAGCYGTMDAFDVTGANSASAAGTATGFQSGSVFANSVTTSTSNSYGGGSLLFAAYSGVDATHFTAGSGFSAFDFRAADIQYSTGNPANPSGYPFTHTVPSTGISYAIVGAVFGSVSGATTTTINTACLGACSGGNNGTGIYLPPPTTTFFNLHFYASQNLLASSQIDNVTLKVAAVHITTSTGTLYVLTYGATGAPSGGNPYVLLNQIPVTLSNGSSAFFIHTNPQTNLAASQYYAVGIMTTTTASRGSGASGSGVSVYETSQTGIVEYKFSVGSSTPPNSFFSSTTQTPRDFIYIHTTFTVASFTTTTTSTVTVGGTATSTVTTTSTNIINQLNMTSAGFWFIPMLFLLAPMALLIVVKRVADGR